MEIRRVRPNINDIEIYKMLRMRSLMDSPQYFSTQYEEALARRLKDWETQVVSASEGKDRNTIVSIVENKAVGLASIYRTDETSNGELIQLWVDASYRQCGIGRKILEVLIDWAHDSGFTMIHSQVKKNNTVALNFLYNNSFKDVLVSKTSEPSTDKMQLLERRL